ncbi:hypothetical protein [Nocardia asiatica]|uniref:hypothetical protein n=1 Tax=Nocardia asiatica TaxID=209252 RepID=UPI00030E01A8|nr:hypothetical protein [Nocardia asiatica]
MPDQKTAAPWPFGDLTPGTYTMTSVGDGDGDAVITDDGRLLVQQHEGCWHDLTSTYCGGTSWRFTKREPTRQPRELLELRARLAELEDERDEALGRVAELEAQRPTPSVDEVEAITAAWLRFTGWDTERIAAAWGKFPCETVGCEFIPGVGYDHSNEDGESRHPDHDELALACEMANVVLAALTDHRPRLGYMPARVFPSDDKHPRPRLAATFGALLGTGEEAQAVLDDLGPAYGLWGVIEVRAVQP